VEGGGTLTWRRYTARDAATALAGTRGTSVIDAAVATAEPPASIARAGGKSTVRGCAPGTHPRSRHASVCSTRTTVMPPDCDRDVVGAATAANGPVSAITLSVLDDERASTVYRNGSPRPTERWSTVACTVAAPATGAQTRTATNAARNFTLGPSTSAGGDRPTRGTARRSRAGRSCRAAPDRTRGGGSGPAALRGDARSRSRVRAPRVC
jgi:hypothetical protein